MKNSIYILFITLLIMLLSTSCTKAKLGDVDKSKSPIVTVLDRTLYMGDIEHVSYYGMSPADSTAAAQTYIRMWISDELMYEKAKQNVSHKKEIDQLVEEYRRSLIVNDYQTRLLKERLSKKVSDAELLAFFNENKEKFKLNECIIKGLYIKVPVQSQQLENFQKWYKQGSHEAINNIEKNILQNVMGYEYFYDRWVNLDDVLDNMPKIIPDNESFLKNNKTLEARDSSFVHLLQIKEYKLIGGEAPFEYIKDNLREAYIEIQRDKYLKQLQTDLYNKALSSDKIKYYVK